MNEAELHKFKSLKDEINPDLDPFQWEREHTLKFAKWYTHNALYEKVNERIVFYTERIKEESDKEQIKE